MAAATIELASLLGGTAVLNFDNATLVATSVTIDNTTGGLDLIFNATLDGTSRSFTVTKTKNNTFSFPSHAVTIGTPKPTSVTVTGLSIYGMGTA
jgi:hypothetical protein